MTSNDTDTLLNFFDGNIANTIEGTFDKMEVAEEEIERGIRATDDMETKNKVWNLFAPMGVMIEQWSNRHPGLFRLHCRELVQRVLSGESIAPGTDAEMAVALSNASAHAPLTSAATICYFRIFKKLFGDDVDLDLDESEYRLSVMVTPDVIDLEMKGLRKKLQYFGRVLEIKSPTPERLL